MEGWPRRSWTNFECTFLWNRSEAQACRRSWKVILGSPAYSNSGRYDLCRRFEGLMNPPTGHHQKLTISMTSENNGRVVLEF